jgi:RimJ/RimL family protein N-acetyltransferase
MGDNAAHAFNPIETERMFLREATVGDAAFILRLVNDPDWLRHIGDRNVHTLADAEAFIADRLAALYRQRGFGLWVAVAKAGGMAMGICGLVKRDGLDDVDIGFAFLPAYRGQGIAGEAARASLAYARDHLRLRRVVAITAQGNVASGRLLERLGLRYEGLKQVRPLGGEQRLFAIDF